jgi:Ca-activated chloride channel homolog
VIALEHPWALLLLAAVPLVLLAGRRSRRPRGIPFAPASEAARASGAAGRRLAALPSVLRALTLAVLIVALAGPRLRDVTVVEEAEGIAIALAVDVSTSMLAEDLRPRNRLGAARQTVGRFVAGRPNDRIALVAFAGEAMTRVPLTRDGRVLAEAIASLRAGSLADGTAIGEGLAVAAARLRSAEERSRVIVLLSDGVNNRGEVQPLEAARAASAHGIRVYTIAMGSDTVARIPVAVTGAGVRYALARTEVDEALLREIAELSGGRYFRARDTGTLQRIYAEIDRLERTPVTVRRHVRERPVHLPLLLAGAVLLVAEWLLRATRWGRLP